MTSLLDNLASPARPEPPQVRLEPVRFHDTVFDGTWSPRSADLRVELPALVPALDHFRGPVTRLLLSAAGWDVRPHHIVAAGRTVSVGYLAGQSPTMMSVLCADGAMFTLRVASR